VHAGRVSRSRILLSQLLTSRPKHASQHRDRRVRSMGLLRGSSEGRRRVDGRPKGLKLRGRFELCWGPSLTLRMTLQKTKSRAGARATAKDKIKSKDNSKKQNQEQGQRQKAESRARATAAAESKGEGKVAHHPSSPQPRAGVGTCQGQLQENKSNYPISARQQTDMGTCTCVREPAARQNQLARFCSRGVAGW
jgi:hypothetical protein